MTPETEAKLRELAHRMLMNAGDYAEADNAFVDKARAMKPPDVDPINFDDTTSLMFFHTARDSADVRDRLISGELRDEGDELFYGPKFWAKVDLDAEAKRLGLAKVRRKQ